jgi:hypothetical protein
VSSAIEVCVDASVAVKVVGAESDSDRADALFSEWIREGKGLIAPLFSKSRLTAFFGKRQSCVGN